MKKAHLASDVGGNALLMKERRTLYTLKALFTTSVSRKASHAQHVEVDGLQQQKATSEASLTPMNLKLEKPLSGLEMPSCGDQYYFDLDCTLEATL